MNNGTDENPTRQNGIANKQDDLQELEIDGVTFVREPDNEYGPRWKVFESGSWEECKQAAEHYGTLEYRGWGFLQFNFNMVCFYPFSGFVMQPIVTFINQQTERGNANHRLTTLGL